MKPTKTGHRVGDWFLWIDCEIAKTDNYRRIPIVTVRKAIAGGDILSTVVATKEMAQELRNAAAQIDAVMASLKSENEAQDAAQ